MNVNWFGRPTRTPSLRWITSLLIAVAASLAFAGQLAAASLPGQPYATYWYPATVPSGGLGQSLLSWNPGTDPDSAFNVSYVPLAARNTPAQVNSAVANTAAGVMSLSSFAPTSYNPSQGAATMAYYDPTYWQYQSQLVFWGGSAGEGLILAPNATVIDAAHRNGVPVLGNIFFPPNVYGGNISFVNDLLQSTTSGGVTDYPVADKLIQVAQYYHFDGWFFNQETSGGNSTTANQMQAFIDYIHAKAPTMQIDWYDSMINTGQISYQEQLDSRNQMFFQNGSLTGTANRVADAFMTDYSWTSSRINSSVSLANSLGRSPFNVYAGINVSGNGAQTSVNWSGVSSVVSGQNTAKVSLALYNPQATFSSASGSTDLARMQNFFGQESNFWAGAKGDPSNTSTPVSGTTWNGIANYIQAQAVSPGSTFVTNFNTGVGQLFSVNGQVLASGEWNNLSLQDVMPTWRWLNTSSDGGSTKLTPNFDFTQAYYGGSSLSVTGNMTAYNTLSLYATQLAVASSSNLKIIFTDGQSNAASLMSVALTFSDSSVGYLSCGTTTTAGWNTATFNLGQYAGKTITGIGLRLGNGGTVNNYTMNVGQIAFYNGAQSTPAAPTNLQFVETSLASSSSATMRLEWMHTAGALDGSGNPTGMVYAYDIFKLNSGGTQTFLGGTPNNAYFVQNLVRSGTENFVTVQVQTVGANLGVSPYSTQTTYVDWQRPAWTLSWQGNGASPGGSGTWSTSAQTFHHDGDANATVDQPWSNNWGDTAVFGGPAGTYGVTVSGSQTAKQVAFNTAGYTLSGGSLVLSGSGEGITENTAAAINSTVDFSGGTAQVGGPASLTLGGTLQDGSLTKIGSGTVTLTGGNTYTGPTAINQGELLVNGSLSSAVTVHSGGTLGGTGTLTSVTVSASGSLSPGDAPGTLNISANLTLAHGAVMDYELDTPTDSDEILMPNGLLTLNGQQFSDFHITPLADFGEGTYTLIDAHSISGTLGASNSGTIDGLTGTLTIQNGNLLLTVVPEPGTFLLLAGAIGSVTVFRLRRLKLCTYRQTADRGNSR